MSSLADERAIAISVFLVFLAGCLFLSMLTSPDLQEGADDFFAERGTARTAAPRPLRQGLALTGDFVSAAGVLYLCGIVAVGSYDGILIIAATALSPLLLKVWLAERVPEGPGWSLGDVLARRLPGGPARRAAGFATLVVCVPLLAAQLVPIGQITAALMGLPGQQGEMAGIALVGVLMLSCAAIGGVRGSTLLQIVKALGFLLIAPLLALVVLAGFDWDYGEVLSQAAQGSGGGHAYLAPGRLFGADFAGRLDTLSLAVTVLLGTAFLPHLVMRLSASRTAEGARRASSWAVAAICLLCVATAVVGYGTQALAGSQGIGAAGTRGGGNLLLFAAGFDAGDTHGADTPSTLLTFIACGAFLAVLASASVLLLAGSAAIVHDMGRGRHANADQGAPHRPLRARIALVLVGAVSIALAVFVRTADAQFWLTLTYTEAATVVLPALGCCLLWRNFTLRGLRWCVYGGTLVALGLLALSPAVSGGAGSLYPDGDWAVFPLHAPGVVSVPAAFLLAWAGSRLTPARAEAPATAPPQRPGRAAHLLAGSGTPRP
ncbi:sodium:solute symporter family transporter [Streptomyces winkii]|uniref:sodium:solute symporter family transporter n=1 Tax=Streptomyces winkii TaxID=3051178 RepID=UPI0028D50194|nr:cation acetate symporter [Streptomyces sp. DSM 40971]